MIYFYALTKKKTSQSATLKAPPLTAQQIRRIRRNRRAVSFA